MVKYILSLDDEGNQKHTFEQYIIMKQTEEIGHPQAEIFFIVEFLVDTFHHLEVIFPHKVKSLKSCNCFHGLHLEKYFDLLVDIPSKWNHILGLVNGIKLLEFLSMYKYGSLDGTFTIAEQT